jgi:hypothetical protein
MKAYKYRVIGRKKSKGKGKGRVLSKHHTKAEARKSAQSYAKKGYTGAIDTRKKATGSIAKKMKKVWC